MEFTRAGMRKAQFKSTSTASSLKLREKDLARQRGSRMQQFSAKRIKFDGISGDMVPTADLAEALKKIQSNEASSNLMGLKVIRNALSSSVPQIQEVVDFGIVPYLASFISCPNEDLQFEAAWSLTNIATGTQAQTETVLLAVPNILQVISNNLVAGLHEQLCWIIGNIAGDADEFRVVLAANGAIEAVIRLTLQESVAKKEHSCLKTALWTLSNLARGSTDISLFFVEGAIVQLASIIGHEEISVAAEACWLFAFLTAKNELGVSTFLTIDFVEAVVVYLERILIDSLDSIPAIRCLGNIATGRKEWVDLMMNYFGCRISRLLICYSQIGLVQSTVLKEMMWVAANLLGSEYRDDILRVSLPIETFQSAREVTFEQQEDTQQSFQDCKLSLLRNVLDALQCDEFYLQREALFCLENLTLSEHLLTLSFEKEFSFGNFVGLLRVPNQVDVSFACMRIISRLLQLSLPIHHDFIDKTMQKFIEHGLLDILDDLQFTAGVNEVQAYASNLVEGIYSKIDQDGVYRTDNSPIINQQESNFTQSSAQSGLGRGAHLVKPSWL